MPTGIREGKLPESLQDLSEKNQNIFKMVLNFSCDKRLTAEKWLKELENFEL